MADDVDKCSVIKDYWQKIGVNLEIQVREDVVYKSIEGARTHKEMFYGRTAMANIRAFHFFLPMITTNSSMVDDLVLNKAFQDFVPYVVKDETKARQILNEAYKYANEQAYYLQFPSPNVYTLWWPWVKNYHGEEGVSYGNRGGFSFWIWIDQDLKEKMTGRR